MIGVFDSGAGGLSVWKELVALMPDQDYIYVGDNAWCPYGEKTADVIRKRADAITRFLLSKGADIIVIACNTATAAAISFLRELYPDTPFVGIEPAVKPAALFSKSGVVGVLATASTLKADKYHETLEKFAGNVKVIERVGEGLVEAVENGSDSRDALIRCLTPMLKEGADTIVLGCTHYPFLTEQIRSITGTGISIINPAPAVAARTQSVLRALKRNSHSSGKSIFYTTDTPDTVRKLSLLIKPDLTESSWKGYEKIG